MEATCAESSGAFLPPSPPAEKATASQDQAGAGQHPRWDGGLPGIPASRRLSALDTLLDAAMIFPVNKIPISTVIEGRGAQEMVALVLRRRIGSTPS